MEFKVWFENTRPIIDIKRNVSTKSPQEWQIELKTLLNTINAGVLTQKSLSASLNDIISSAKDEYISPVYINKKVKVPFDWETTYNLLQQLAQKLNLINKKYKLSPEITNSISQLTKYKDTMSQMVNLLYKGHGQRYEGEHQDTANRISVEVRDKVLEAIKNKFLELGRSNKQLVPSIQKYWKIISDDLKKPIAFSALVKESVIVENSSLDNSLGNLLSLLQTPRIWRNEGYVSRALDNVNNLLSDEEALVNYDYGNQKTISLAQNITKLLPNIISHFEKNPIIKRKIQQFRNMYLLNFGNEYDSNKNIILKIIPEIQKTVEQEFNIPSKNRNNYLKAINFYFNRVKGLLGL